MALPMTSPTKHPKTGIYRLRMGVPEALRASAKALYGNGRELIANLRTKDGNEAKRLAPQALAELQAKMEAVRAAHEGRVPELSEQVVQALGGQFYREEYARLEANPGSPEYWENEREDLLEHAEIETTPSRGPSEPEGWQYTSVALPGDLPKATALVVAAGHAPTPDTVTRVAKAIFDARYHLAETMQRRAERDWGPDENLNRFPVVPAQPERRPRGTKGSGHTFEAILAGWALDRGWSLDAKPIPRALYDRQQTLKRLGEFLGHREAGGVSKADAVRWKEDMQVRGLKAATIRNDISEMSAIWKYAIDSGKVVSELNPFKGILPPKPKRAAQAIKRPFTQEEAVTILTSARAKRGYMRWLPWVCCLTGARISEICQSFKEDVKEIDGIAVLSIHDEGDKDQEGVRSIKNEDSRRVVPIHPALVAEGFLDYVETLPSGSALFPDAKPDAKFGIRSINAAKKISRWLKVDLQITDDKVRPNHSWRHWFMDACRRAQMSQEARSTLTGHSAKLDESAGYGVGMRSFVTILSDAIATVQCPVEPLGHV